MPSPYRPIDCAVHDELLARATLRRNCVLRYLDEQGEVRQAEGVIEDVYTKGREEFLRLRDGLVLRLDQLVSVDDILLAHACD